MNVSPDQTGLVLSYRNQPGRSIYVLEQEWGTFSHVPKEHQIEGYLILPRGIATLLSEDNGVRFYGYREGYDLYRVRRINPTNRNGDTVKVARCVVDPRELTVITASRNMPTSPEERSIRDLVSGEVPDRLQAILAQIGD